MSDRKPINWNDPSQAIPHTIHLLDAMKEDLSLSNLGIKRSYEVQCVASDMDLLLGEVERRMETRPDYFHSVTALCDLLAMMEFWAKLLSLGAVVPLEIPTID